MTALVERPTTRFPEPVSSTAPTPAEARGLARDEVRLLVARPGALTHARFRDLPEHLSPGDLVVVNDSATVAAEADAELLGRGPVVLHAATGLDDGSWVVEIRTAPHAARAVLDARAGDVVVADGLVLALVAPYPDHHSSPTGRGTRLWRARVEVGDVRDVLDRIGRPIAYGYLDHRYPLSTYQSVFSARPGSAEMPSAGRPFTTELVTRLLTHGIAVAPVTLHTGVSSQEAGESPQPERFEVPPATARLVNTTRAAGRRVVAVGTTVTRALESAVAYDDGDGRVVPTSGWTERVVSPAHPARVVSGLVTGWHDPQASHLLLVESIAGPAMTQAAYDAAVAEGYLWHEFGDSALLLP
jgi:S-adenosylmethionine:tRNA ribosyltransferase-isomerase